jgi:hypothetical protein
MISVGSRNLRSGGTARVLLNFILLSAGFTIAVPSF